MIAARHCANSAITDYLIIKVFFKKSIIDKISIEYYRIFTP